MCLISIRCAYFPDGNSPVTAVFNSESRSFEIDVPVNTHPESMFMDISFLGADVLRDDPDCVNNYLILNARTTNLVSRYLAEKYYDM